MTRPRIYVACLAAYNARPLHGARVDADHELELSVIDSADHIYVFDPDV